MRSPRDIDLFLLDMDGTIYLGNRLFECTKPFLETVRAQGKRYLFLTNNSSKDRMAYVEKLGRLGIEAAPDDIFTSGEATTILLLGRMPGAAVAVFGMPTLEREFREAGFRLVERDPDVVVLGFDQTFDYAKMTRLCDLVREGRPYIATHPDFNCPVENGFIPDIGAMIAYVKASTGREPDEVVGKPHAGIVEAVFGQKNEGRPKIALQMFIYDILAMEDPSMKDKTIINSVYQPMRFFSEGVKNVPMCPEFRDGMMDRLHGLLSEISDLSRDWSRTSEEKTCSYCDFKMICGR